TPGAFSVLWHPRQLPPHGGGVAARGKSLAVLVAASESEGHAHREQAGVVAGALSVTPTQDRPQHLRPPAGQQQVCAREVSRLWLLRNRMSESLTYGSVGGPVGQPPALPGTASPPGGGSD